MRPRKATVIADRLTIHSDPGSKAVVGYLRMNERVRIVADPVGPPQHARTWYKIESERVDGSLVGWVAEGDGKDTWLQPDAPHEEADESDPILAPRPRPPLMPDPPFDPMPGWPVFAVLAFLLVVLAVIWGAS